ncbi:hypothetical protein [Nocardioides sp. CFH 31398]|uniref:hypothetical protein n=1 Tax=Nocardioides sp. CFH 31398 TaxID=2919579 RepID=UPI001F05C028|nr:hypothetical protein [Nocardioides sp. CFH 31398]MCH1865809.1 hypothetical protein [Nocardioides sp. CFH 31398]
MPDPSRGEEHISAARAAALEVAGVVGGARVGIRYVEIGRTAGVTTTRDGEDVRSPRRGAAGELRDALRAHRALGRDDGRRWYVATLTVEGGDVSVDLDYDRPPPPWKVRFRLAGAYLSELERFPRPSSAVQGWMKVELAQVGAWDLVADEPRWDQDHVPTGEPQTPESVGVDRPAGAEHAVPQPLPADDLEATNRLAIAFAEQEERRTGVFPPEMVRVRDDWG